MFCSQFDNILFLSPSKTQAPLNEDPYLLNKKYGYSKSIKVLVLIHLYRCTLYMTKEISFLMLRI